MMRRQRIFPFVASRCSQVPVLFEKSSWVMPAPTTRPRPLNTSVEPPVAATTTFLVPSLADFFCTTRGAKVSEAARSHLPVGSDWLTTQLSDEALRVQPDVRLETSEK